MNYIVTVDSSYTGDSVNIVDTFYGTLLGTYYNTTVVSPWTFTANVTNNGTIDNVPRGSYMYFIGPATKVAATTDTVWGVIVFDGLLVTNPCSWSNAGGMVYLDNNSDCEFDSGDVGLLGANVSFMLTTWEVGK